MIHQIDNTEQKRQNYASAIYHAHYVKDPPVVEIPKVAKIAIIAVLALALILGLALLGQEFRQPFELLSAGISPFAEQTVIFTIDEYDLGVANAQWVSTKTLSGKPVAVLLKWEDTGIWEVAETKLLDSDPG